MIFAVSYTDNAGTTRSREFVASSEFEVRQILRRQGISPQAATIIEVPSVTAAPGSEEDFQEQLRQADSFVEKIKIMDSMSNAEIEKQKLKDPQNPTNFYKVLTNDEKPGEYNHGEIYEYKHLRLDYKGRGITQEIHILDVDGVRVTGWFSGGNVPTLPEILQQLGNAGWKMIGHQVNQDLKGNGVTFHYYNFMRVKKPGTPDRVFPSANEDKNIVSTAIESLGG